MHPLCLADIRSHYLRPTAGSYTRCSHVHSDVPLAVHVGLQVRAQPYLLAAIAAIASDPSIQKPISHFHPRPLIHKLGAKKAMMIVWRPSVLPRRPDFRCPLTSTAHSDMSSRLLACFRLGSTSGLCNEMKDGPGFVKWFLTPARSLYGSSWLPCLDSLIN